MLLLDNITGASGALAANCCRGSPEATAAAAATTTMKTRTTTTTAATTPKIERDCENKRRPCARAGRAARLAAAAAAATATARATGCAGEPHEVRRDEDCDLLASLARARIIPDEGARLQNCESSGSSSNKCLILARSGHNHRAELRLGPMSQHRQCHRRGRRRASFAAAAVRLTCALLLASLLAAACLQADAASASLGTRAGARDPLVRRGRQATGESGRPSEPAGPTTAPTPATDDESNNNSGGGATREEETTTPTTESAPAASSTTAAPTTTTTGAPAPTTTGKPRIPPVNYTRVDQLFEGPESEREVQLKWERMDKTLKAGVGAALKIIFPHIVSMASDAKVSGSCSGAILKWILNLKNMRTWAVRMLDAIGKPSAGLLEGSLTLFGNYKQCLGVRAPDEDEIELTDNSEFREYFRGQYCVLQIRPPLTQKPRFYSLNSTISSLMRKSYKYYEKTAYDDLAELAMAFNFVNIRADLCVPSLCSRDDIQRVADYLASKVDMRARVQRCEIQPPSAEELPSLTGSSSGNAAAAAAAAAGQIDASHLLWSLIFVIVLLLVLVSTLTSLVFRIKSRSSKSKSKSLFTSMSVYRSLSHMRNVQLERINDSKPVVLYALRIILLLWIFLANLTSQLNFQYLRELLGLRETIMLWPMQLIVNSSLAWESLILLTAFTYSYQNINSNLSDLIKYNLAKYTRLMPSIMLMVALTIITPLLYPWRSPLWHDFVDEPAQVCKSSGFVNIFFLQNHLNSRQVCLPQTWIFCVELQLCLLALPLVYLMNKTFDAQHGAFRLTSAPILLTLLLALAGTIMNSVNVYTHQLPAAWFQTFPDQDDKHLYFTEHLYKTATHLTTFAVGLFTGHLCRCQAIETFSGRPYGRRCCDTLMWLTASLLMLTLVFCTHSWSLGGVAHLESPLLSAAYAGLAPLLWAVALSLILFQLTVPNELNQRSSLATLLTSDVNLVRLGRLSFLAYLINPYVNTLIYAVQEQAIFSSIIMLAHTFIGNLVITFALAFVVSALVELPCRRLFKKLLIGSRRQTSNLDIITRQLDIRERRAAQPQRHAFSASKAAAVAAAASQQQQQQQMQQNSVMIPLK